MILSNSIFLQLTENILSRNLTERRRRRKCTEIVDFAFPRKRGLFCGKCEKPYREININDHDMSKVKPLIFVLRKVGVINIYISVSIKL